ncbi:MAG: hypothetical protein HQK60_07370 [Deltaproteobacteria bacterium]|nr:hypothetical protein [Deltaproteobacteria bacterium]
MQCAKCQEMIEETDAREMHGQTLCEDCYMSALSPTRTCDPWAVHSAKNLLKGQGSHELTQVQTQILSILTETGGVDLSDLSERMQISPMDLERDMAALRHMEKIRAELRAGKKVFRLW